MPPFDFDKSAMPPSRIDALEEAVNSLAGGGGDSSANAQLDQRLTNQDEAFRLTSAAIRDLDQRHKDLYAKFTALEARLSPAPPATAPMPAGTAKTTAAGGSTAAKSAA